MLALLNPLFGLGGIIATPDIPLLFFWSLSLLMFEEYINHPTPRLARALGICLGLGFCSKYHIVLFPLGILFWLTVKKQWHIVKLQHVRVCVFMGLLFSLPVLIWNFTHDFDSFAFQLRHGLVKKSQSLTYPLEYLGGQILLLFPLVLIPAIRFSKKNFHSLSIWAFLPLVFFFVTSLKSRVEPNWPIMAYPAVLALAVLGMQKISWKKTTLFVWTTLFVAVVIVIAIQKPRLIFEKSKLKELNVYRVLKEIPYKYSPLFAGSYQVAAQLNYMAKKSVYKLRDMNRRDFYDYLTESKPSTPFYVVLRYDQTLPEWAREYNYSVVEELGEFQVLEVR